MQVSFYPRAMALTTALVAVIVAIDWFGAPWQAAVGALVLLSAFEYARMIRGPGEHKPR